jgi:hypothetical protein
MKKTLTLVNEHGRLLGKMVMIEKELERRFKENPVKCDYCKQPLIWRNGGKIDHRGISVYVCDCRDWIK